MGVSLGSTTKVEKGTGNGLALGNLSKRDAEWRIGHGWDDSPTQGEVDSDLWMVALTGGVAVELVRYDENDETKIVVSPSGGLTYLGDARSGAKVKRGDDEKGVVNLRKLRTIGVDKVLIIASIYKPDGLTYDMIDNAYIRAFPMSQLMLTPEDTDEPEKVADPSKVASIPLTEKGKGARTVVFGWLEFVGSDDLDWALVNQPSHAPDIVTALAPFGIS